MIFTLWSGDPPCGIVVAILKKTPVCSEDYCEQCGDCLECHGEDDCYGNGEHKGEKHDLHIHLEDLRVDDREGVKMFQQNLAYAMGWRP